MKAVNAAERQKWLVALGSSKAGLADTRTKKERGLRFVHAFVWFSLLDRKKTRCFYSSLAELTETTESLKTKMSELRLYCDLLMQQVHTIHESVGQEGDQSEVSHHTPYKTVNIVAFLWTPPLWILNEGKTFSFSSRNLTKNIALTENSRQKFSQAQK